MSSSVLYNLLASGKFANIGSSDSGLLPENAKPSPGQMLTYHQWCPLFLSFT